MADVSANSDGKVSSDGTWGRGQWVGSTKQGSSSLDGIGSLPYHGTDRSGIHVLDETGEERLRRKIFVVLLEMSLSRSAELQGCELVSPFLESRNDFSDESLNQLSVKTSGKSTNVTLTSLDTIRFDSNEGLFSCHCFVS